MSAQKQSTPMSAGFSPLEHAILAEWLSATPPFLSQNIDIWADVDETYLSDDQAQGIRLRPNYNGDLGVSAIDDAVARICLEKIQSRLPQWLAGSPGGEIITGRKFHKATPRPVELLPQLLFSINWADSGPGFSWPVSYYVTYIPGYHRYVVTESADSPDVHGYCDVAIWYFDGEKPLIDGCRDIIVGEWGDAKGEYEQSRWVGFLGSGQIDFGTADEWADEVWGDERD